MGLCASKSTTDDTLIGGRVVGTTPKPYDVVITDKLIDVPIGTVVCFDNGAKKPSMFAAALEFDSKVLAENVGTKLLDNILPRIGIVINELGVVKPVTRGNASVLNAIDLECVSLVAAAESVYVATEANGVTHVFRLRYDQPCIGWNNLYAEHIAQGKLNSPPGAGEVEATCCYMNDRGVIMMLWAGRGGDNMKESWTRQAPFNVSTGDVDESQMEVGRFANIGPDLKWRTVSSLQVHQRGLLTEFWFTCVYDGTDVDGIVLDPKLDQTSGEAKRAFKSYLAKTTFGAGPSYTDIVATYEGVKIEAISLLVDPADKKVKAVLLGSDDESMGSLLGIQPLEIARVGGMGDFGVNAGMPRYVDLGKNSMYETLIPKSKFGTSGLAPPGDFALPIVQRGGRV